MLHTTGMTMPDLGPERPGAPSETRQMVERNRMETEQTRVSTPAFFIALGAIVLAILGIALIVR
jgi:hypothetical protein